MVTQYSRKGAPPQLSENFGDPLLPPKMLQMPLAELGALVDTDQNGYPQ